VNVNPPVLVSTVSGTVRWKKFCDHTPTISVVFAAGEIDRDVNVSTAVEAPERSAPRPV
jgi:hypothetical protein